MDRRPSKKKLSRNLLDMKFMKRTKEKTQIEDDEDIRAQMFENEVSDAMRKGDRFVSEPSFVPVEQLMFGRLAFKGMNTEIESMMAERDQKFADIESRKREKDVTDEDMASRYSGLVATMGNKFATKRNSAGQPQGDRRQALLDLAGQTTNAHTSALLSKTEDFLSESKRDEEDFLAQVRESERCQEDQPMHPEMALMARKKQENEEWKSELNEYNELHKGQIHPEMAFMAKKKQKKSKAMEKQTNDFLSQMRNELGESSEPKKPKFQKPQDD